MKRIYSILLILSFAACASAQVEQRPLYQTVATVVNIIHDIAVLQTTNTEISYEVPADSLELKKKYLFLLDVVDCGSCKIRKAIVVGYAITPEQAQKDMNALPKKYSHRKIIKN